MLNQNTRSVLGQLSAINNTMIISYPTTCVIMGKSIQAFLDVSKLGEEQFEEIGVYRFDELNTVVSLIDDAIVTNDAGFLTIKDEKRSIRYKTSPIHLIESESRASPDLVDRIKQNKEVLSFEIDVKELASIKKMANVLKDLSDLVISSTDVIKIKVTSKEQSSNNYVLEFKGDISENVEMIINMDSIAKLPSSSYKVTIYKSQKGSLVAMFDSINVPALSIIIAAKSS